MDDVIETAILAEVEEQLAIDDADIKRLLVAEAAKGLTIENGQIVGGRAAVSAEVAKTRAQHPRLYRGTDELSASEFDRHRVRVEERADSLGRRPDEPTSDKNVDMRNFSDKQSAAWREALGNGRSHNSG